MANELRRIYNFLGGELSEPLAAGATTLTNEALRAFPVVGSTEHMPITFNPDGEDGAPFVKWITAHAANDNVATITAAAQESWANGGTAYDLGIGIPFAHAPTQLDYPGQPGGMGKIGFTPYAPVTDLPILNAGASTTLADADATNLKVSFITPPTGKVLVRLSALMAMGATQAGYWGLREGSSQVGKQAYVHSTSLAQRKHAEILVTGLTPGQAKTYKWAYKVDSSNMTIYGGPTYGDALMEVETVNY